MSLKQRASLTGALLVRKGAAIPVQLVQQALADEQGKSIPQHLVPRALRPLSLVRPTTLRAVDSPATFDEPSAAPAAPGSTAAPLLAGGGGGMAPPPDRAKLSLRVDRSRHLRVKLVAAHLRLRVQDILTAALDSYLNRVSPDVSAGKCACVTPPEDAQKTQGSTSPTPSCDGGPRVA